MIKVYICILVTLLLGCSVAPLPPKPNNERVAALETRVTQLENRINHLETWATKVGGRLR